MTNPVLDVSVVSGDYLPNIGGVATHVHELARALSRLGDKVRVISFRPGSALDVVTGSEERDTIEGVAVRRFSLGTLPRERLLYWRLRRNAARLAVSGEGWRIVHA